MAEGNNSLKVTASRCQFCGFGKDLLEPDKVSKRLQSIWDERRETHTAAARLKARLEKTLQTRVGTYSVPRSTAGTKVVATIQIDAEENDNDGGVKDHDNNNDEATKVKFALTPEKIVLETQQSEKMLVKLKEIVARIHQRRLDATEARFALKQRADAIASHRHAVEIDRIDMEALHETVRSGLEWYLDAVRQHIILHRTRRALDHLHAFHIVTNDDGRAEGTEAKGDDVCTEEGVATILSLPLPRSVSLWSFIPLPLLTRALNAVAKLLNLVSHELGITLPHPILRDPRSEGTVTSTARDVGVCAVIGNKTPIPTQCFLLCPPVPEFEGALNDAEQHEFDGDTRDSILSALAPFPCSVDRTSASSINAVLLLQANLIHLCSSAGVCANKRHPPEALIANIMELQRHLHREACAGHALAVDVPLPEVPGFRPHILGPYCEAKRASQRDDSSSRHYSRSSLRQQTSNDSASQCDTGDSGEWEHVAAHVWR